tara:strand:- start:39 stop:623 length:585 start_codon:yes stop_codon:yes gene_type:complete
MDINYSQNFFKPYFFNKCLGEKEISKIINLTNPLPFTKGTTKNPNKNIHRDSDIKWIDPNQSTQWLFDELTNLVNYANKNFWGFDIINYNSSIQYTEYTQKGKYDWHHDQLYNSNSSVRKLSIVIQLSSPQDYLGGILQLNDAYTNNDRYESYSVPRKLGLISIFPSHLPHKVTSVAKGNRKSLVWWVEGPPFK